MSGRFDASVELRPPGKASVSERKDGQAPDRYASDELVDHYIPKIELSLYSTDPDEEEEAHWGKRRITLSLHAYHIENAETGRAFHTSLEVALSRQQGQVLRDALSFFLAQEEIIRS
jgi:hypothetical protein